MTSQGWLSTGALLAAAAVGLGAFAAHGLKTRVTADLLAVFETAARYHLIHALAIVAVAWVAERYPGACATAAGRPPIPVLAGAGRTSEASKKARRARFSAA